jgi:selenocysteine-specific elongation factor
MNTGTVEVSARVIMLEGDEIAPGGKGWIQLYLDRAIAAAADDRFVLRVPSPAQTVAGGRFVDVAPRRHPRHDSAVRESLVRRAAGNVLQEELRKYPRGVTVGALLKATLAPRADIDKLRVRRLGDWLYSDEAWTAIAKRASHEVEAFHITHPLRPGMAREELRSRLGMPSVSFPSVIQGLIEDGRIVERNGSLASPQHRVELETAEGPAAELLVVLGRQPFAPPSLPEAMQQSGATEEVVRALVQRGDLVRASQDIAFTKDAYEAAVSFVREIAAAQGSVTVAELRDRMGASRRPVLALLEYLDAQRVTRRVGDARVLR